MRDIRNSLKENSVRSSSYFPDSKENSVLSQHSKHPFLYADVEPWTFEQHLGEAVFIPAGCPHQVRNRQVI